MLSNSPAEKILQGTSANKVAQGAKSTTNWRLMTASELKADAERGAPHLRGGSQDKSVMCLPQPKRAEFLMTLTLQDQIRRAWPRVDEAMLDASLNVETLVNQALKESNAFRSLFEIILRSPSGTNLGEIVLIMLGMRHRVVGGRTFQICNELERNLELTDLGDDLPCEFLKLPYQSVYLESGSTRTSKFRLLHKHSGEHIYEGAYCQETKIIADSGANISPSMARHLKINNGDSVRMIDLCFIGSPVGHDGVGDDATYSITLAIPNEEMGLKTMLDLCQQAHDQSAIEQGFILASQRDREITQSLLYHIAKQLLYINMKDARLSENLEASDAAKKIAGLGANKLSKAMRRAERLYDRIIVGAGVAFDATPTGGSYVGEDGRHVTPHWRRGFYRNQRFGEGLSKKRLTWISPVLVNSSKFGESPHSQQKDYVVKV